MARRLHPLAAETQVEFALFGRRMSGSATDTYASAAIADDKLTLSRSLKYHRPRGAFCLEGHCSGCIVRINGRPNLRACQALCASGAEVSGQNAFPSPNVDLFGAVDKIYRKGLDHHTIMTNSGLLNAVANRVVRKMSGLGTLPAEDADHREANANVLELAVDVCIVGGGPAGLAAAQVFAANQLRAIVIDEQPHIGGSYRSDVRCAGVVDEIVKSLANSSVTLAPQTTAIGFFASPTNIKEGVLLAAANIDHGVAHDGTLLRVVAKQWLWTTGAYASNLAFANNDHPAVFSARAAARLLSEHDVLVGDKPAIVFDDEIGGAPQSEVRRHALALADQLRSAGANPTMVTLRNFASLQTPLLSKEVQSLRLRDESEIECDAVVVAALPAPASEGPRMQGCVVELDPSRGGFGVVVDSQGRTSVRNVFAAGDVTGYCGPTASRASGAAIAKVMVANAQTASESPLASEIHRG